MTRVISPTSYFRTIEKVNLSTGAFTDLHTKEENWNYAPPDPYTLAGRKSAAIYVPFWQSSVAITPTENQLVNVTLGCVRADDGTVNAQSLVFGPASAASGNANRIVYGATYSPTNDAMYLATSKVANADQGSDLRDRQGRRRRQPVPGGAGGDRSRHRARRRALDEASLHPGWYALLRNGERQAHGASTWRAGPWRLWRTSSPPGRPCPR